MTLNAINTKDSPQALVNQLYPYAYLSCFGVTRERATSSFNTLYIKLVPRKVKAWTIQPTQSEDCPNYSYSGVAYQNMDYVPFNRNFTRIVKFATKDFCE